MHKSNYTRRPPFFPINHALNPIIIDLYRIVIMRYKHLTWNSIQVVLAFWQEYPNNFKKGSNLIASNIINVKRQDKPSWRKLLHNDIFIHVINTHTPAHLIILKICHSSTKTPIIVFNRLVFGSVNLASLGIDIASEFRLEFLGCILM